MLACWPGPGTGDRWLARFAAEFPLARHVAIGVDRAGEDGAGGNGVTPAEFLAAGLEPQRDTVLTCAAVGPPPHPSAAAEIRRLESDADWRQSVDLALRCFDHIEPRDYLEARAAARRLGSPGPGAGRGSARSPAACCWPSSGCSTRATATPGTSMSRPTRRPGAGAWPETLVWHAGRYGREVLGASTFVIVADPADVAIRVYRACGFADRQRQFAFERPPAD